MAATSPPTHLDTTGSSPSTSASVAQILSSDAAPRDEAATEFFIPPRSVAAGSVDAADSHISGDTTDANDVFPAGDDSSRACNVRTCAL